MISETFFSSNYTSIWRSVTPTMDEFVRRINLDGYQRIWPPINASSEAKRRGLINEAGFILFCRAASEKSKKASGGARRDWLSDYVDESVSAAGSYIYGASAFDPDVTLHENEKNEIISISIRLFHYFTEANFMKVKLHPVFLGCGIIQSCSGDVLVDNECLYEIKSGDRSFRSIDFRQIVIYLTLYFGQFRRVLPSAAILNPRTGLLVKMSVEDLCRGISGQPAADFFESMIDGFSAKLISE